MKLRHISDPTRRAEALKNLRNLRRRLKTRARSQGSELRDVQVNYHGCETYSAQGHDLEGKLIFSPIEL